MEIDFTTTATMRPAILARTLNSFATNFRDINLAQQRLSMNIDMVPDPGAEQWGRAMEVSKQVCVVASEVFKRVISRRCSPGSFPAAVKWCWSQPTTEFFFHLEDDWTLEQPVRMQELVDIMQANTELSCISLRAYNTFASTDQRICLSPGLFRTAHAKIMAERLSLTANPEKQLRPRTQLNPEGGKHGNFIGMQHPSSNSLSSILVKDIGREWLDQSGWRKVDPIFFTKWEKVP